MLLLDFKLQGFHTQTHTNTHTLTYQLLVLYSTLPLSLVSSSIFSMATALLELCVVSWDVTESMPMIFSNVLE